jgi:hypothetical protein
MKSISRGGAKLTAKRQGVKQPARYAKVASYQGLGRKGNQISPHAKFAEN